MKKGLILSLALLCAVSCAKESQENAEATGQEGKPDPGQAVTMIPNEEFSQFDIMVNAHIKPYFDGDGTVTEKAVQPGDVFDIFVVAEFNENFTMAGAEYRLDLPAGVVVMSSVQSDSVIVSLGKHDVDFMITFRCISGPKHWLVKYICKATEDFKGGSVATGRGNHLNFLGFTMCDAGTTEIKGRSGKAVLSRK